MRHLLIVLFFLGVVAPVGAQVNLQTGSAAFTLPIFNWQDDKSRLNAVLGLEYTSGNGLRVNDIAENVGQGWNLIAGGEVTRIQVGQPDDQQDNEGNGTIGDVNKYPPGWLYNTTAATQGCPNGLFYSPIFSSQNTIYNQHNSIAADREQDYFTVQFNGRAAMFVLSKSNGDIGYAVGNSKLKIWFQRNAAQATANHIRTTIVAFYVQDENGLIYTFSALGLTKVLHIHPAQPNIGGDYVIFQPAVSLNSVYYQSAFDDIPLSYSPYVVTSWHLTSIQDPITGRSVTFNYQVRNINNQSGDDITYYTGNGIADQVIQTSVTRYAEVTHHVSITQDPVLSSITYPDGHSVNLNYDLNRPRFDLNGDYPLSSIDIVYNFRYVSRYLLNTAYFVWNTIGYPVTDDQRMAARLCLRSVTKVGADLKESQPPYQFDYYTGSTATYDFVPPPFYYEKDPSGYYNPASYTGIPLNPMPLLTTQLTVSQAYQLMRLSYAQLSAYAGAAFPDDNGYPQNGLLKTITYPAGKTLTWQYQQNAYERMSDAQTSQTNSSAFSGGVHVTKTIETDGGYSNGSATPIVTNYNYIDPTGTVTSQWGFETPLNNLAMHNLAQVQGIHNSPISGCSYSYIYPGILSKEEAQSVNDNSSQLLALLKILNYTMLAETLTMDILELAATSNPASLVFDVMYNIIQWLSTNCQQDPSWVTTTIYEADGNYYGSNTLPVQFNRVEVSHGSSLPPPGDPQPGSSQGAAGKTVYTFTDYHDYALWDVVKSDPTTYHNLYSMKQRAAPWAYGLPKLTTVYDANGYIVKQTQSNYNFANAKLAAGTDQSCNCAVDGIETLQSGTWGSYSNTSAMTYYTSTGQAPAFTSVASTYFPATIWPQVYQVYTGRVELTDSYDRTYQQQSSQYQEVTTHYDYNLNNFQVRKITTTESNGDTRYKEIYYSCDYTISGALATLNTNNIVDDIVATYSSITKAGSSSGPVYLAASVNDYGVLANGQVKAFRTMVGRSSQPVTGFSFDPTNPLNYPSLAQKDASFYDGNGVLVGTEDEGGRWMTNIYDVNDKLILATVANANPLVDKPSYTSFEQGQLGGWTVGGTSNVVSAGAVTGTSAFVLSSANNLSTPLNAAKPSIVSFWASSSGVSVGSGASLIASAPTINGMTFYEYLIPQGASSVTLTAGGSVTVDELRAYPKLSRMRTTAYDPILGKTADCDENNRITYYQYDNLARLRFIKDEYGNIVKMYEYNNRSNGTVVPTYIASGSIVYAQIAIENETTDANDNTYCNVVLYFYADAAGTQPVYVSNLSANYQTAWECDNGGPISSQNNVVNGSGTSIILGQNVLEVQQTTWQDEAGNQYATTCSGTWTLLPGNNYNIIAN